MVPCAPQTVRDPSAPLGMTGGEPLRKEKIDSLAQGEGLDFHLSAGGSQTHEQFPQRGRIKGKASFIAGCRKIFHKQIGFPHPQRGLEGREAAKNPFGGISRAESPFTIQLKPYAEARRTYYSGDKPRTIVP